MRVVVVTPPPPVVSLNEARQHLRVDGGDEDALITGMIAAAQSHIDGPDGWLGRAIGVQTLEARTDTFHDFIALPYPPVIGIISVKHLDAGGSEVTVDPASYEVGGAVLGVTWGGLYPPVRPGGEAIRIRYLAGYETIPAAIRAAILLMVGDLYRHRGETVSGVSAGAVPMSTTVDRLLAPFRVWR